MSRAVLDKIIAKLSRLDEYLRYLTELQKVNRDSFLKDYHAFGLAERYLHLAIEVLVDVGKLLVVAEALRRPEDNEDIFVVLSEQKVLSADLLKRLHGIAGFRNILVHEYEKIDRRIVYERLQKNPDDFKDFKTAVLRYLRKKRRSA